MGCTKEANPNEIQKRGACSMAGVWEEKEAAGHFLLFP